MTKDPRVYLAHVLECAERIERFTAKGREYFLQEEMVQDAVLRNFEVIGEAAKRLDDNYRAAHPQVPWRALAGLRDVLIHQYEGVALARVWTITVQRLAWPEAVAPHTAAAARRTRARAGGRRPKLAWMRIGPCEGKRALLVSHHRLSLVSHHSSLSWPLLVSCLSSLVTDFKTGS
jgi:uncharacterized protein with HEPN domain